MRTSIKHNEKGSSKWVTEKVEFDTIKVQSSTFDNGQVFNDIDIHNVTSVTSKTGKYESDGFKVKTITITDKAGVKTQIHLYSDI